MQAPRPAITPDDIEHFRRRALECRARAEIECQPALRQEHEQTALAYERMAERGERWLTAGR